MIGDDIRRAPTMLTEGSAMSVTKHELLELLDTERRFLQDLHSMHVALPVPGPWVGEGNSLAVGLRITIDPGALPPPAATPGDPRKGVARHGQ
jgi:hypothetical protein